MQLTLAEQPVMTADELLVLARWSEAQPAHSDRSGVAAGPEPTDEAADQLRIRLDETQIPLWDQRRRA